MKRRMNIETLGSFGKYKVRCKLPCSAGYSVYEAWNPSILHPVVIKTLLLALRGEGQNDSEGRRP